MFYWIIAALLAELSSAIPSSAGVYHWASVTAGPKYGRPVGFFAGWWNYFAWTIAEASVGAILGNASVQMYSLYHPDFVAHPWHVFIVYIIFTLLSCALNIFGNRLLPMLNQIGLFLIVVGGLATIICCAALPGTGGRLPHATSAAVWTDWSSDLGYTSEGFVFVMGMLNGAYGVGAIDAVTHLSEEIPHPEVNVPRAIAAEMIIGFVLGLSYLITIFYSINDIDALFTAGGTFPITKVYLQATSSPAGAVGLTVLLFVPNLIAGIGCQLTASRTLWTLARDRATPFPNTLSHVSKKHRNPVAAQLATTILVTVLGCIYVGNTTAFNAFVGAFVVFSIASFVAALLPHLLTRRRHIQPGPFYIKGVWSDVFLVIACAYIIIFIVIFCFPFSLPVTAASMNYTSLIFGGVSILVGAWWLIDARKNYMGPLIMRRRGQTTYLEAEDGGDRNTPVESVGNEKERHA